jgi:cell division protein FtsB
MIKIVTRSLLAILALYLLGKLFLGHNGLIRQFQVQKENEEINLQIDSLEHLLDQKKMEKSRLLYDSLYMEQVARTRYGFSRKGEAVFQFLAPQDSLIKERTQPPTVEGPSK